jgi:hypothetical protein
MYFFVRFTGIISIIFGALLMLLGVGTAIYGFVQYAALLDLVNNYWLAGTNSRLTDVRSYAAALALLLFLVGMLTSALGQLLLVFADVARNTQETNLLLRGMRNTED